MLLFSQCLGKKRAYYSGVENKKYFFKYMINSQDFPPKSSSKKTKKKNFEAHL